MNLNATTSASDPAPSGMPSSQAQFRLASRAEGLVPYAAVTARSEIDLWLDSNEGPPRDLELVSTDWRAMASAARRYPNASGLERSLAARLKVEATKVIVTAGGDDAIDRACRVCLEAGRELVLPVPTFEMIGRFATIAGAAVVRVPWESGPYPIDAVLGNVKGPTAMIALVSPNNPTGAVATRADLLRLSREAPHAMLLVDLAYAEFCEDDLTDLAVSLPNTLVVRTFSKAYGLAGLRVGYAVGPAAIVRAMRAVGGPYPVSAISLAIATDRLEHKDESIANTIAIVTSERSRLRDHLEKCGAAALPSQANFVLGQFKDAHWVRSALASLGIAVRGFADGGGLESRLRITCPGDPAAFDRLLNALISAIRPEALLFDLDDVLADVSMSYRRTIVLTAESFGVRLDLEEILAGKRRGDANNDWTLTHRLLADRGINVSVEQVTERFERLYQGDVNSRGLEADETLIVSRELLQRLAERLPLAIVTGRSRRDVERFLARFELGKFFRAAVCMEDGPGKPSAMPVRAALQKLEVNSAWFVGDTPDDIRSARAAGVVSLGVAAPGENIAKAGTILSLAGAARVLASLDELEGLLP
jgi:histidinol-phosphate aminotransferase